MSKWLSLWLGGLIVFTLGSPLFGQCDCATKPTPAAPKHESNGGAYIPDQIGIPAVSALASSNGVTEAAVEDLLERFAECFPDITFRQEWNDATVNAIAFGNNGQVPGQPDFGRRQVVIFGGMLRHPAFGKGPDQSQAQLEGISIILAHEVGHHYGNTDKLKVNKTASSPIYSHGAYCEGQSDFWATRVGLRILYNFDDLEFKDNGFDDGQWSLIDDTADSPEYLEKVARGIQQCNTFLTGGLFVDYDSYILGAQFGDGHDDSASDEPDHSLSFVQDCGHPVALCRFNLYTAGANRNRRPVCSSAASFGVLNFKPTTERSYQNRQRDDAAFGPATEGGIAADVAALRKEVKRLTELLQQRQQEDGQNPPSENPDNGATPGGQ